MTVNVVVVSPYPTVRAGLRALLQADDEIEIIGEAQGVLDEGAPLASYSSVLLVDAPVAAGMLAAVEASAPETAVVVLGADVELIRRQPSTAARGFLTADASAEELAAALKAVAQGLTVIDAALAHALLASPANARTPTGVVVEEQLTPREIEVLQLLAAGLPNKTIALRLGISEHTAKFHVSSVLSKLGAASRTEAVTTAARQGLLML